MKGNHNLTVWVNYKRDSYRKNKVVKYEEKLLNLVFPLVKALMLCKFYEFSVVSRYIFSAIILLCFNCQNSYADSILPKNNN